MCGLAGIVIGKKHRTRAEIEKITGTFSRLLLFSEYRGPYATGAAWLKIDGKCRGEKAPVSAEAFIKSGMYRDWRKDIDARSTVLMGHTRYPTQGSHMDNCNNQPLVSEEHSLILTHNGHIPGVEGMFKRLGLHREFEVDSELLLRLGCRHLGPTGLCIKGLLSDVKKCPGQIAAVFAASSNPDEILFVRRERPLVLAYHDDTQLLAYASEQQILENVLWGGRGWHIVSVPPFRALVVHADNLFAITRYIHDL